MNLLKPADEYFRPGSTVSGTVRYTLDKDDVFEKIIVSMKGIGRLRMRTRNRQNNPTYRNDEDYVDIDYVIYTNEKKAPLPRGSYETKFSFTLPPNIPSSLKYHKTIPKYVIKCKILYYIRIKFEKPDLLQFDTRFKKNISVVSEIIPRLPTVPTICGEQKALMTLSQLFSNKKSVIEIKANIENSVLQPGGKIEINYEVSNDTNIVIKGVESKLKEVYTFTSKRGHKAHAKEDIPCTDTKTCSIKCGDKQTMDITINVPVDKKSLEHSKLVSRQYFVVIQAILPLPHRNTVLKIPIQIDDNMDMFAASVNDAPPSYWEAVGEETKEQSDDDDDEVDCDDGENEKK